MILGLALLVSSPGRAVLGPRSNIPRLAQLEQTEIYVFKDHHSKTKYTGSMLIQNKDGEVPKLKLFSFDRSETRLNYFKAWTVSGGQKQPVPDSMIQITPANEDTGFSNHMNVEVAFPRMTVGAVVEWQYEIEELNPPLQGFFSFVYRLDSDFHMASGFRFHIDSEVPLYSLENDPTKVLQVSRKKHTYDLRLKQDVLNYVINEPYSFMSLDRFPTAIISSENRWDKVDSQLIKLYNWRLAEPKTSLVNNLVRKVKAKSGAEARFRELSRLMAQSLRYMGDWRGRFSSQVPRSLKEISDSQFGDCKDFSLIAVRVLRELGYPAQLATIYADRIPVPDSYYTLPVNYFNHQIVYLKIGKKEYWLDPTSTEDFAFIDDSLSDRMAVVWENHPIPRRIPSHKDADNGFHYKLTMSPKGSQFGTDLKLDFWGLESKFARGEEGTDISLTHWVNAFFPDAKAVKQEIHFVKPPKAKPWAISQRGSGGFENILDRTPVGEGFRLNSSGLLKSLMEANSQWRSDFDFGFPSAREYQIEIQQRNFVISGKEKCQVDSPWVSISLDVKNSGSSGIVTYKEDFRVTEVPNKELRTKAFRQLQDKIRSCLMGRYLLVRDPSQKVAKKPVKVIVPVIAAKVARPASKKVITTTVSAPQTSSTGGMTIALKRNGKVIHPTKVHSRHMKMINPIPAKKSSGDSPADALAKRLKVDDKTTADLTRGPAAATGK